MAKILTTKNKVLQAEAIRLEPLYVEDISDEYVSWLNDPEINRYLEVRFTDQTRESVAEYVLSHYQEVEKYIWAINLGTVKRMVGTITLSLINWNHKSAGLGIMLGRTDVPSMVSTQALNLVLEFAFDYLKLNRITAENISANHKSNFMLRRAGFTCEGKARQMYSVDGEYVDGFRFAILCTDWRTARVS